MQTYNTRQSALEAIARDPQYYAEQPRVDLARAIQAKQGGRWVTVGHSLLRQCTTPKGNTWTPVELAAAKAEREELLATWQAAYPGCAVRFTWATNRHTRAQLRLLWAAAHPVAPLAAPCNCFACRNYHA